MFLLFLLLYIYFSISSSSFFFFSLWAAYPFLQPLCICSLTYIPWAWWYAQPPKHLICGKVHLRKWMVVINPTCAVPELFTGQFWALVDDVIIYRCCNWVYFFIFWYIPCLLYQMNINLVEQIMKHLATFG